MMIPTAVLFLLWFSVCAAQTTSVREFDSRTEERANRCVNLSLVLDNWKYAIMTQVKDLLLHDHDTVLPAYGRIQPLSVALADLYGEFNALKERLSQLTSQFDTVEAFVDLMRVGGKPLAPRAEPRPRGLQPGSAHGDRRVAAGGGAEQPQGKRTRVVIRRVKIPAGPHV